MIKKSTIDDILFGKVAGIIGQKLNEAGFKYQKSKKQFLRQHKGFDHVIGISAANGAIYYDEETEEIYLLFYLWPGLSYPAYEKWFLDQTGEKAQGGIYEHPSIGLKARLDFDDFSKESFYEPTASQQFKMNIARAFSGPLAKDKFVLLPEFLNGPLTSLVNDMAVKSDVSKLFDSWTNPLAHTFLLVYAGMNELADRQLDLVYKVYVDDFNEKMKTSSHDAARLNKYLDKFIENAQKLANKVYSNPFVFGVKSLSPQGEQLKLSEQTTFTEMLRLDTSEIKVRSYLVNKQGELLVLTRDFALLKFSSGGEKLLDTTIRPQQGFAKFSDLTAHYLEETDEFFVNNFIITRDNKLLLLALPATEKKEKELPSSIIAQVTYDTKKDNYLIIYYGNLLTYSRQGVLLKSEPTTASRTIPGKERLVYWVGGKRAIGVSDQHGNSLGEFEYGNGNNHHTFSADFRYLACYGYSTKSQFYDLKNNKEGTLWAHPTYIKDYTETMYNDIEHNFGMEIAAFSPDNQYLVGAAWHGKYVAWTLPDLERYELIPPAETFELMARRDTIYSDEGNKVKVTLPALVELNGEVFFKNQGNAPRTIFFIDNGDAFCMSVPQSKLLLTWDRTFKSPGYLKANGVVTLHSERYLTRFEDRNEKGSELVVYRKA